MHLKYYNIAYTIVDLALTNVEPESINEPDSAYKSAPAYIVVLLTLIYDILTPYISRLLFLWYGIV